MPRKYTIRFRLADEPVRTPVTKFGGQPVWLSEPQWPLSRSLGSPMQFIGQIELFVELFGHNDACMAYIFMTDWNGESSFPDTFDPDSGENAVVLQPGTFTGPTTPLLTGPSLYRRVLPENGLPALEVPCEFAVELLPGEDPDQFEFPRVDPSDRGAWQAAWEPYWRELSEDKIGGTPVSPFHLAPFPYPEGGPWKLLLQLNEDDGRFIINFGTDGIGYALLSQDGHAAKFLWARP